MASRLRRCVAVVLIGSWQEGGWCAFTHEFDFNSGWLLGRLLLLVD